MHNIPVIGLTSVFTYKDGETRKLHSDIAKLITDCNVQNVVILWDADCLNVSEKDLVVGHDVSRRPFGFYSAAGSIRKLLLEVKENLKVYFSHIDAKDGDPQRIG